MSAFALHRVQLERVLHGFDQGHAACLRLIIAGGALHGLALGASSGLWPLALFSAIKVPLLLLLATAVCLPSFYVLHAVLGLRDDFAAACKGLLSAQAALAITLGAVAPVAGFLAISIVDLNLLTLADAALFAIALWAGQRVLRCHYVPLLVRDPRHRITLASWATIYGFVAIQLAWVLRPFLGTPGYAVEFFRTNAFEQNAYVVLVEHIGRLFR